MNYQNQHQILTTTQDGKASRRFQRDKKIKRVVPNGLRYWFGELRANFANGRNSTKKLPIRRRRKPNPVHAMLAAVLPSNYDFERFLVLMPMFKTEKINHNKKTEQRFRSQKTRKSTFHILQLSGRKS